MSEQSLEASEIVVFGRREEPSRQLVALLARRMEAGSTLLDVAAGATGELANILLALADDRRDLRIAIVEDVVKQEHGSLFGRQALQQHQHRQRQRVGFIGHA